jgi:hypothetical protein
MASFESSVAPRTLLFWLHSAARERNLRTRLADLPIAIPIATGARDHATSPRLVSGRRRVGGPQRQSPDGAGRPGSPHDWSRPALSPPKRGWAG